MGGAGRATGAVHLAGCTEAPVTECARWPRPRRCVRHGLLSWSRHTAKSERPTSKIEMPKYIISHEDNSLVPNRMLLLQ